MSGVWRAAFVGAAAGLFAGPVLGYTIADWQLWVTLLCWDTVYFAAISELARIRDRQAKFQQLQDAQQRQLVKGEQWARLDLWVDDLAESLGNPTNIL